MFYEKRWSLIKGYWYCLYTLPACLLTIFLAVQIFSHCEHVYCLVCTVVLIINHLFSQWIVWTIILCFATESTTNMALPYSPPLAWSTHVGSNARGPHYHNRFRNEIAYAWAYGPKTCNLHYQRNIIIIL